MANGDDASMPEMKREITSAIMFRASVYKYNNNNMKAIFYMRKQQVI